VVIVGAGGAARAIAFEARRRGGIVRIVRRDDKKAESVAREIHVGSGSLRSLKQYDILINTTPAALPISSEDVLSGATIMDITSVPKETELLLCARSKGCNIIYGSEMFFEQAKEQQKLWQIRVRCGLISVQTSAD
jgi:3-dehydroquinate dehydratase/shikimate dehydrogenase